MDLSIKRSLQAGAQALKRRKDGRHYKYSSLSTRRREIRVLVLGPGQYNDELRAEVCLVDINEPHHLRYEAVSHSCAVTTGDPRPIKVSVTRRLWVQPAIAVMLQHLRYKDENRALWIDQLCVNQDDVAEKSAQASLVTDIFKAADRAVIWLGPEGADSGNAFSLLEDLGWMVQFDFENMRMRPSAAGVDDPSWADPNEPLPYDQDDIWSVYELIYRSWFGRAGSRQEIAAKPTNATVVCGFRTISWDVLCAALGCFANKPRNHLESPDSTAELRFARRYDMVLLICQTNKVYTFSDLLEQSRKFSCLNPLDHVYSVLSLATDINRSMGFTPDYAQSKADLYLDTVVRHITYTKTTNILASCGATSTSLGTGDLPSWVPDWTRKRLANAMPLHVASSHSEAYIEVDGKTLRTQAIRCGRVESTVCLCPDFVTIPKALAAFRRCAPPDVLTAWYPRGNCTMLEAYCATIVWGLFSTLHAPPIESYPSFTASVEALRRLLTLSTDPEALSQSSLDDDLLGYATRAMGCCKGRAVITTDSALLGLAPRNVRGGDEVWVILGCDVPLILRPSAGNSESGTPNYQVVGDSYVHGLMTGEALLGTLPPDCRLVLEGSDGPVVVRNPTTLPAVANAAAVDVVTGLLSTLEIEDPRLIPLRAKVREANIEATTVDDLLDPQALRAAGIPVEGIQLI